MGYKFDELNEEMGNSEAVCATAESAPEPLTETVKVGVQNCEVEEAQGPRSPFTRGGAQLQ